MLSVLKVDETWYLKKYPEAVQSMLSGIYKSAEEHFQKEGHQLDLDPNPAFSTRLYKQTSGWHQRIHRTDPLSDYLYNAGEFKGSINWIFDEAAFQHGNPAAFDAIYKKNLISGLYFYCKNEAILKTTRPHALFNAEYYREVANVPRDESALVHYLTIGQKEGLAPSVLFDRDFFRAGYGDIDKVAAPYNSLEHYFISEGIRHGQQSIPDFDPDFYLETYPEIKAGITGVMTAFQHFLLYGIAEGRRPNPFFDTTYYLENNPTAAQAMTTGRYLGAFEHFLEVGSKRGLKAHPPLRSRSVADVDAKTIFEKHAAINANLLVATKGVRFKPSSSPKISLIIPVYNHFNFTMQLLGRLSETLASTEKGEAEVIVVDNGSTDRTTELETLAPGIRYLRLSKPLGYTLACNEGAKIATGEVVLFLNNDIELGAGAIWSALEVLSDESVGATGGRIVQLSGALQEAGGLVWKDGSTLGFGRGENPDSGQFLIARDVDYVSGCFLAMRRALFEDLGGFSEDYAPGYYEEVDLCARIWDKGLRVVFDPRILLYHYEYASYSAGRPPSASTARIASKRKIFKEKNQDFIKRRAVPVFGKVTATAFARGSQRQKHILVIEDQEPHPRKGAGFNRSGDIVRGLRENGWSVTILARYEEVSPDPNWSDGGFTQVIREAHLPNGLDGWLKDNDQFIDAIWICRTHNFLSLAAPLQAWKEKKAGRRVIADTEAVASTRIMELRRIAGMDVESGELDKMVADEIGGATFADVIVAVNELDRDVLDGKLCDVAILGQSFVSTPTPKSFAERNGFLFVGAVNRASEPNYDSLMWFAQNVWPMVRSRLPDATLTVIANWNAGIEVPDFLRENGVTLLQNVADLVPYFDDARVFVAPTRFAGGIPHKVQNALAYGLPTVCSELLARQLGLNKPGSPLLYSDVSHPQKMADNCVEMHSSESLWVKCRAAAIDYIVENCNWSRYRATIADILSPPLTSTARDEENDQ
ncbi:glycosyltransferase [Asticcacaulis sp. BYS171W]|uniref:Glycosyltransferase n=1 Tax=Asticcacaulis aquaticus TaxID=2984212 RepID=A0ABT5HSP9_9CAUL|nr:glycosyltransferase [Asticcacaulis aquaticus]MDC7682865.1 glycosyltransferase [Asticcacaulis aquaticus]